MNKHAKSVNMIVSWVGIKITYLVSRSTITKIVSISSSQTIDLVFLHFHSPFYFHFDLFFLFLEHRVRASEGHESQDT